MNIKENSFGEFVRFLVSSLVRTDIFSIDGTEESGRYGRLLNHSRVSPNCITKVVTMKEVPRLIIVAKQTISPGEELLYDYGDRSKESLKAHPWLAL